MDIKLLINHEPESPSKSTKCDYDIKLENTIQQLTSASKRQKINEEVFSDEETSSVYSSRRSTATSISSAGSVHSPSSPSQICCIFNENAYADPVIENLSPNIENAEELLKVLQTNTSRPLFLNKVSFKDYHLPKYMNIQTTEEENRIRQDLLNKIQERYVDPLLELTGYKWVRKEVPSRGKGLKIFSVRYLCSQQKVEFKKSADRSRQLTHPLKQFNCQSSYLIKYVWSKQTIEITYNHVNHPPYKRLPDELKPFILDRLDKKALDLYNEIINEPRFSDIKHLIFFSKVQSFWSKERTKRRDETTKLAFKNFFDS